jgi:hypothetical protein
MVKGIGGNAGGASRCQEVDCLDGSSNVSIAFVIVGWDVVWVRLLVFRRGWLNIGHYKPK